MTIAWVDEFTDERIATGDLSRIAPHGGFTAKDRAAIKRAYMLPCRPKVHCGSNPANPANVETILSILKLDKWNALTARILGGDTPAGGGGPAPDPHSFARDKFLSAAARFPYFCGEKGIFDSVEEACKRELAAMFAHGTQETGEGGQIGTMLYYTREQNCYYGNCKQYMPPPCGIGAACVPPFECRTECDPSQYYYGRGLKQLTDYYNYAGLSAAYYGDLEPLLQCADRVGSDGDLAYTSGLWFYMTPQPPKPSIHDLMLGHYAPAACTDATVCKGITFDATTGVYDPFDVSISVINGGVECGTTANPQYKAVARNRSELFKTFLTSPDWFGAIPIGSEVATLGCEFIERGNPFAGTPAADSLALWLELSGCRAVRYGVNPPISILAVPSVEACLSPPPGDAAPPTIDCGA